MGRQALWENAHLNASEHEELLGIFLSACQWTRIYYAWRPNLRDEADNHVIELAVAGPGAICGHSQYERHGYG